jgi:SH3-like domain-containing protein
MDIRIFAIMRSTALRVGLAGAILRALTLPLAAGSVVLGPVTERPLPRYVSMKADTGNVRRGPGLTHRVDWIFRREDMPLQITAEYGNWRRVRDLDGATGWMHYTLLSGVRTVFVTKDYTPLRMLPDVGSEPNAYAEQGVIALLKECGVDWCRINADGNTGWVLKSELWGVDASEIVQ